MTVFLDRSIYYYFLMREVTDTDEEKSWQFIARHFGVKKSEANEVEKVLKSQTLGRLSTPADVEIYKNYLASFCKHNGNFGNDEMESIALDFKLLALNKTQDLFGNVTAKGNRLRSLSHIYEKDHTAAVLYALHVLYLNKQQDVLKPAEELLLKELNDGKNSDAGLVLLFSQMGDTQQVLRELCAAPDMLVRPQVLKRLAKLFGEIPLPAKTKQTIGF